jgi:hypothetical protein
MEGEVKQKLVSGPTEDPNPAKKSSQATSETVGHSLREAHPAKQLLSIVSVMIAFVFVYNGISRLMELSTLIKTQFSVFSYAHSIEMISIGAFLLLAECKTPLFKQNVRVIYKPFARVILLFIFSVLLYTGATELTDFYIVTALTILLIMISQCVPDKTGSRK